MVDVIIFDLFATLVCALEHCKVLTASDVAEGKAEFLSFVVETRRRHSEGGDAVPDVDNVATFPMRQFAFQSRHCLLRIIPVKLSVYLNYLLL